MRHTANALHLGLKFLTFGMPSAYSAYNLALIFITWSSWMLRLIILWALPYRNSLIGWLFLTSSNLLRQNEPVTVYYFPFLFIESFSYYCDICLDRTLYARTTSKTASSEVFWAEDFDLKWVLFHFQGPVPKSALLNINMLPLLNSIIVLFVVAVLLPTQFATNELPMMQHLLQEVKYFYFFLSLNVVPCLFAYFTKLMNFICLCDHLYEKWLVPQQNCMSSTPGGLPHLLSHTTRVEVFATTRNSF